MVKWCPGCGDHAILAALLNTFPKTNHKKENICMVSGIGCSSRIPYYVDTYGFHSIHGRACTIATDVKLANPALSVWVSMGDEDQMEEQMANGKYKCVDDLLNSGDTWEI